MTADLLNPIFTDASKAREHLEALRWSAGRFCPHCGETERTSPTKSKAHAEGLYYCNSCKKTFTVTIGTIFERSHIPLNKWMLAFHLMNSSKKGVSAHQLHRMLGVTYKSAWFMAHRIREAMRDDNSGPIGGDGEPLEVDETYVGPPKYEFGHGKWRAKQGVGDRTAVVTLVERNGRARSIKVERVNAAAIREIVVAHANRKARLITDEGTSYKVVGGMFASHETVNHSRKEYARGDVTTNTVEGFFSIFKRGMRGVYQHCGEQHLQRYLTEFDFRYSYRTACGFTDAERTVKAIKGAEGKRLMYRQPRDEAGA